MAKHLLLASSGAGNFHLKGWLAKTESLEATVAFARLAMRARGTKRRRQASARVLEGLNHWRSVLAAVRQQ